MFALIVCMCVSMCVREREGERGERRGGRGWETGDRGQGKREDVDKMNLKKVNFQ